MASKLVKAAEAKASNIGDVKATNTDWRDDNERGTDCSVNGTHGWCMSQRETNFDMKYGSC